MFERFMNFVKVGIQMRMKLNVTGMTCAACSARVEKVSRAVAGVESAEVNLLAGTMVLEAADEQVVS